jgi:hypothetical protein
MKIIIFIIASVVSTNAFSFNDNPYDIFDASKNFTKTNIVNWVVVDNASEACQKESRRRGYKGWPYKVYACSFWNENNGAPMECTIITGKQTNMHQLGHEIRHCFQGPYHD